MARTRTGIVRRRRHKKVLKLTKGQWGTRSKNFKRANEAMMRSLWYAYRDRRQRRRQLRRLWIQRINAASRLNGLKYSQLIHGLKRAGVDLDRKSLAGIAIQDAETFGKIAELAKQNL